MKHHILFSIHQNSVIISVTLITIFPVNTFRYLHSYKLTPWEYDYILGNISSHILFPRARRVHFLNERISQIVATKKGQFPWCPIRLITSSPERSLSKRLLCLKNWNRWERLFQTHAHTKGKNESMYRRETWSNCSLPLCSWFPGITVVFLTFLRLTAGPASRHAITQWNLNTHFNGRMGSCATSCTDSPA